jgi:uncharacterized protein YaaN involved in tellurite resistance
MNINFDKETTVDAMDKGLSLNLDLTKAEETGTEIQVMTKNEIADFTTAYKMKLRQLPEVQNIVDNLEVTNMNAILDFGQAPAEQISQVSDQILANTKLVKQEEVGEIMTSLTKIISQFDMKDFEGEDKNSFFSKMFKKVQKTIDELIQKYDTMGSEVEKVYITLKKYENDIQNMAEKQKELGEANILYYRELERYIVAGEMALEELDTKYLPEYKERAAKSGDNLDLQNYNKLVQIRDMLNTRVYDLQLAENVALQTLTTIQQVQQGNFMLLRTIKSEFIVTLPIFKQGITQAIMLKRQALIAKNVDAVRQTTNELIVKNAQNTATQSVMMADLATRGAVDIDKLQESYNILKKGSDDAQTIIQKNMTKMDADRKLLEDLKYEMVNNQRKGL